MGCRFLLQGIFRTQGSNSCLLCLLRLMHRQVDSLPPALPGLLVQGCCNESLQTRDLFPHSVKAGSPKSRCPRVSLPLKSLGRGMGGPFLSLPVSGGSRQPRSGCMPPVRLTARLCVFSSCKDTSHRIQAPPTPAEGSSLITSTETPVST